jgi:hypothetical protein
VGAEDEAGSVEGATTGGQSVGAGDASGDATGSLEGSADGEGDWAVTGTAIAIIAIVLNSTAQVPDAVRILLSLLR